MWLPWDIAAVGALLCFAFAWAAVRINAKAVPVSAVLREIGVVASLYALWQLAGRLSVVHLEGAIDRGQQLWDLERALHLPSEAGWQAALLPHSWLVKGANIYYAGAHVPAMGVFLVWLFFRHRTKYRPWRTAVGWVTGVCLVIQLLPVAPPRLVPGIAIADTGVLYGQSVYATFTGTGAGQLQAMPSIHVAWAVLIGWAVWRESHGRWRWIGWFHAAMTTYVVAVTGNHYWVDGIVAAVILVGIRAIQTASGPAKKQTQPASSAEAAQPV